VGAVPQPKEPPPCSGPPLTPSVDLFPSGPIFLSL
jgi:hypothetical protein